MDRDANYFAVGAFVLLVLAMGVSFVFWYTDQQDRHSYLRYEIYFPGTVSGLTQGSPVRYLGVDVGKVVRIMLDPQQRKRVQVIADIDSTAPIDASTQASLSLQGITGLLYIDLEQERKATPAGALPQGLRYPVIRSAPSDFDVLLASLPQLVIHGIELVDHIDKVFNDDNVRSLNAALDNTRRASERLPTALHDIQDLVADMRRASTQIEGAAADLRGITSGAAPELKVALQNIRHVSDNLASTSEHLDRFVTDSSPEITRFANQSLPELERLLRDSRDAAREFRDLSRTLKQNPSQLLYEPNAHGVEVAR